MPFRRLETSPEVRRYYPGMYEAAAEVGSWQIRNQATPGGNLCTASPACEIGPILYALDAQVEIAGPKGRRRLPVQQFITGVRRTVLEPDELLLSIQVPHPGERAASHYIKLKERQKMDIAFVGVAAWWSWSRGTAWCGRPASPWARWPPPRCGPRGPRPPCAASA